MEAWTCDSAGCQYSGAGQYFSGATSRATWALNAIGKKARTGTIQPAWNIFI
jgi:hypothetical protein